MAIEIAVPELGESVLDATVSCWFKKEGDSVDVGEALVELETDKVNVEVCAKEAGILEKIEAAEGEDVKVGDVLGWIGEKVAAQSVARNSDMEKYLQKQPPKSSVAEKQSAIVKKHEAPPQPAFLATPSDRREERVRMSRRRRTIAQRLLEAKQSTAMLTTFNEIDMNAITHIREQYNEKFQKRYGVKLGFVSFFVKASIGALKAFPQINAEIDGDEIIFKAHYDIGMAIGSPEGLVVPLIRNADQLSLLEIEQRIKDLVAKSEQGKLLIEDLRGGTFTITNGGVFGSLLSTPILNSPQVGILGLHTIKERPVASNGQVVIRPMMYVALSYDHRAVDGREAVQFLVHIKQALEDPAWMLVGE